MRLRVRDPRLLLVVSAALLGAAVAFPLGAIASHQFTDVPNTNTFHADIDAIRDAGVTTGCAAGKYCPKDFVTREQMAAFLNRLGALGPDKTPVVNADKVDGHDEVLVAEDIVQTQVGPWQMLGDPIFGDVRVSVYQEVSYLVKASSGQGWAVIFLQAPGTIGETTYGLKSVEFCHGQTNNATIIDTTVWQSDAIASPDVIIADGTDRPMTAAGCYTLVDPTPQAPTGGTSMIVQFQYAAAASAGLSTVRTTWTPVP